MTFDTSLVRAIVDDIDQRAEGIVNLTAELIRIPFETHPPGGDEGPVQRYIAARLADMGLTVDVFEPWSVPGVEDHPGWWPGLSYDDRPNVVGVWKGTGG